ncbi:DnaD domain-containing protein [Mycoplasmopsis californica]|uniref:Replicative helicase loading/DNA remodeling protein DnaB N-terminal winged helix domain-containing protein n=1 Tax=Mycoplasmopsis equigenitalium TaxID=114883 RepID=A0ABY5J0N2_9BACT|nr:hypothetical protein [Mycoplasmopsis equigenitalium]UUD36822.1 hypothetical protein NPA09_02905 [Mycoplasmopsis equigenitalium]VEU69881.1 DnaD domain-containing protein [Mycoplasmopsis californica]
MQNLQFKVMSKYTNHELEIDYVFGLYNPILNNAIDLYKYLLSLVNTKKIKKTEDLLAETGLTYKEFNAQRKKLEACSLLTTLEATKKKTKEKMVFFELIKPLDPFKFFNNKLLESLLVKKTSKIVLQALKDQYAQIEEQIDEWDTQDISAGYDEVFDSEIQPNIDKDAVVPARNKIALNRDTSTIQYVQDTINNPQLTDNLYFHLLNDSSINFYEFLIKTKENYVYNETVIRRTQKFIVELSEMGFDQKSINLFFSYAFHVNNKIINEKYVRTIAKDLLKKDFTDFESIEEHLNEAFKHKRLTENASEQFKSKKIYLSIVEKMTKETKKKEPETKQVTEYQGEYNL